MLTLKSVGRTALAGSVAVCLVLANAASASALSKNGSKACSSQTYMYVSMPVSGYGSGNLYHVSPSIWEDSVSYNTGSTVIWAGMDASDPGATHAYYYTTDGTFGTPSTGCVA